MTSLVSKSDGDESKHEVLAPGDLTQLSLNLYKRDGFLLEHAPAISFLLMIGMLLKLGFFLLKLTKKNSIMALILMNILSNFYNANDLE